MKQITNIKDVNVLYDNIVVKPIHQDEQVGGLVLPQQYEDKPQLGEVINVGEGRHLEGGTFLKVTVKPGNIVLFNKYSTTEFTIKGETYLVLREEDVIAFV